MIRAVIVDDEPLARERIRTLLQARPDVTVVAECRDGREAVEVITRETPDLVFLDIKMPELNGFEVVDALEMDPVPAIVFITAFDEFAVRAFQVAAIDYLLKPVEPARLDEAVTRVAEGRAPAGRVVQGFAQRELLTRGYARRLLAREGDKLNIVRVRDIEWAEAAANYVKLHTARRTHIIRTTIKSLEQRLDPNVFVRVHRTAIVNVDAITSLEPLAHAEYNLTLISGARVRTSRSYAERLRPHLG